MFMLATGDEVGLCSNVPMRQRIMDFVVSVQLHVVNVFRLGKQLVTAIFPVASRINISVSLQLLVHGGRGRYS